MKTQEYIVQRYDADDGKVFDWKEPRTHEEKDEEGKVIIVTDHLYAKTIYLGIHDSIDNYVEVPVNE